MNRDSPVVLDDEQKMPKYYNSNNNNNRTTHKKDNRRISSDESSEYDEFAYEDHQHLKHHSKMTSKQDGVENGSNDEKNRGLRNNENFVYETRLTRRRLSSRRGEGSNHSGNSFNKEQSETSPHPSASPSLSNVEETNRVSTRMSRHKTNRYTTRRNSIIDPDNSLGIFSSSTTNSDLDENDIEDNLIHNDHDDSVSKLKNRNKKHDDQQQDSETGSNKRISDRRIRRGHRARSKRKLSTDSDDSSAPPPLYIPQHACSSSIVTTITTTANTNNLIENMDNLQPNPENKITTSSPSKHSVLPVREPGLIQNGISRDNFFEFYTDFLKRFHKQSGRYKYCFLDDHLSKVNNPPRCQSQTFHPYDFYLVVKAIGGFSKMESWSQVARNIGFNIKNTNIPARIKDWCFLHHIVEFIDYLMGIPNQFYLDDDSLPFNSLSLAIPVKKRGRPPKNGPDSFYNSPESKNCHSIYFHEDYSFEESPSIDQRSGARYSLDAASHPNSERKSRNVSSNVGEVNSTKRTNLRYSEQQEAGRPSSKFPDSLAHLESLGIGNITSSNLSLSEKVFYCINETIKLIGENEDLRELTTPVSNKQNFHQNIFIDLSNSFMDTAEMNPNNNDANVIGLMQHTPIPIPPRSSSAQPNMNPSQNANTKELQLLALLLEQKTLLEQLLNENQQLKENLHQVKQLKLLILQNVAALPEFI